MADQPVDLSAVIQQGAIDPASASVDGQSVAAKPIADLILADQYLNARAGITRRRRGIRTNKVIPAGAMSDCGGRRIGPYFGGGRW